MNVDLLDIYSPYFFQLLIKYLLSPPCVSVSWVALNILSECDEGAILNVQVSQQKLLCIRAHRSLLFQCRISLLSDLSETANTKGDKSTVKNEDTAFLFLVTQIYCHYRKMKTDYLWVIDLGMCKGLFPAGGAEIMKDLYNIN